MLESAVSEKHEKDVRKILEDAGCLSPSGRLVRWNGKKVLPLLELAGHDSISREDCKCRELITKTTAQEWAEFYLKEIFK